MERTRLLILFLGLSLFVFSLEGATANVSVTFTANTLVVTDLQTYFEGHGAPRQAH